MHGTLEELRDHYPGTWLLIELDDSEAEEVTYSIPEGHDLPTFAL